MSRAPTSLKQLLRTLKAGRFSSTSKIDNPIPFNTSDAFTVEKSKFQGFIAPVTNEQDICSFLSDLYTKPGISKATHNMFAYKFADGTTGYNDDGETGGGQAILRVLEGSELHDRIIVVSRWYGGVLMGPSRFRAIADSAKLALLLDK